MAAKVSQAKGSPAKLRLDVGINLLSPLQGPKTTSERSAAVKMMNADDWCKAERLRLSSVTDVQNADDNTLDCIDTLHREVQSLCVLTLQHDMHEMWSYFVKVLQLLEPIKTHLQSLPECQHYLERIVSHCDKNYERLSSLGVVPSLAKIFPMHMKVIKDTNSKPKHSYCPTPPERSGTPEMRRTPRHKPLRPAQRSVLLPDGTNPYMLKRPGEEDRFEPLNQSLTFGDLRKSIAAVGREAAQRESIWNHSAGFLLKAFEADLPEDPKLVPRQATLSQIEEEKSAKAILEETMRASSSQAHPISDKPMDAREAIAYFAQLYHLGKIKHMYFNIVNQQRWSPYEIYAVPKQKIDPDHYVFSTFGVLAVSRTQSCEVLSLGEWFRQAVLHKAVSSIPFFKNYLIRRYFQAWLAVCRRTEYDRKRKVIAFTILRSIPNYNNALLSVAKLLHELNTITFLPLDNSKCYTIGMWKNVANYQNIQSEKFLERFFMHCRNLIDYARKVQFDKLAFAEKQVGNKAVFTKESLHLTNKKQKSREDHLKQCQADTNRLGNFVKMVDQVILAQFVHIIKSSVAEFTNKVIQNAPETSREAMFKCALQFNKGELDIYPTRAEFSYEIKRAIHDLPQLLCDVSYGIDADYLINDRVNDMVPETRYASVGAVSKDKAVSVSGPKLPGSQKQVRLTVDELASHTMRSENGSSGTRQRSSVKVSLNTPDRHQQRFPSKEDDSLLVRTPDLAVPMEDDLTLQGHGYFGKYAPLTSRNVAQILENDLEHQAIVAEGDAVLDAAFDEIQLFVQENAWFNEIEDFCNSWNVHTKLKWKDAQAYHIEGYNPREQSSNIEQQLVAIKTWTERIKNFEKYFLSTNQVVLVDCTPLHDRMVPRLNDIYKDIIEFVADNSNKLANGFISDMQQIIKNMKNKTSEISTFAQYAKQVSMYKTNTGGYQQKVEYIKSLFEVVRMSYRQLTTDEEKLEAQVMMHWEMFLGQMQDASEYINTQTPVMMNNLEQSYESLIADAERLGEEATSGDFLDPKQNPTKLLIDMRHIRDEFYQVRKKLEQASKWKEAITGDGYQLSFLQEIGNAMDVRQELWKYVEVSSHAIKDWKSQLFKKMSAQKALDKITEWLAVATQIQSYLPAGDLVLAYWFNLLEDFKKELPILHKMASDALKPAHWKAIFVGMGERYEDDWEFTVEELLGYNLGSQQALIDAIYSRAKAEYRLEQKLVRIERLWSSNDVYFKLAKLIPDSVYAAEKSRTDMRRTAAGAGGDKNQPSSRQTPQIPVPKGLDVSSEDLYILIETEELRYLLEDSQVSLQQMLASPYISGFRADTENMYDKVREVDELLELWTNCQSKWVYLMRVFEDAKIYTRMSTQAYAFESVHSHMKEIQKSVIADPGVMTITTHTRGSKGYKVLQGDHLRNMLTDMIKTQEVILKALSSCLEKLRLTFPRLYFTTDNDIISMMSVIRSPQHFIQTARKCFPGLETMRFELPNDFPKSANVTLDYQLNSDKLEAVLVFGEYDECLSLLSRVPALHDGAAWLSQLDKKLKTAMVSQLHSCVLECLDNENPDLLSALEEIAEEEKRILHKTSEGKHMASLPLHLTKEMINWKHRLLRFPLQCLVTAEQVIWAHRVSQALKSTPINKQDLIDIRDTLQQKMERLTLVMTENSILLYTRTHQSRMRLSLVLRSLIQCNIKLINATEKLLSADVSCENCFDWSSMLRYSMQITPILRAKAFVHITEEKIETLPLQRERSLRVSSEVTAGRTRTPLTPHTMSPHLHTPAASRRRMSYISGEEVLEKQRTKVEVVSTHSLGPLHVDQLDYRYRYDHEYLGPKLSLIHTPLTDRAHHSLVMSMRDFKVGTLMGPSCTGKTDTVLSLAQMMGSCVFPVTCSEELELSSLQRIFSGVVQSGCWALFDNSDRLTLELMSVAAQQLQVITHSLRTLRYSTGLEYSTRGFPLTDKPDVKSMRRNSLTTLHPLPQDENESRVTELPKLMTRVNTFIPDREGTTTTYFGEPQLRRRCHSIDREINIRESDQYKDQPPPPLFFERVVCKVTGKERMEIPDKRHPDGNNVSYNPCYLGNIMYNGRLIPARDTAACFMIFNSDSQRFREIPPTLRALMRPCAMITPDRSIIIETYLHGWGYENSKTLTHKLSLFLQFCETQLSKSSGELMEISLKTVLQILQRAGERKYNPLLSPEFKERQGNTTIPENEVIADLPQPDKFEESIVYGLTAVLQPRFQSDTDAAVFRDIIRDVFPLCSDIGAVKHDPDLVAFIKDQLRTDGLQSSPELIEKVLQLYTAMQQGSTVLICGAAGSGKSVLYRTLSLVLNKLHIRRNESTTGDDIRPSKPLAMLRKNVPKFLQSLESREKSQLLKKWGSISRSFARLGGLHKHVSEASAEIIYPKVNLISLCPSAMSTYELFGGYQEGVWKNGTLSHLIENINKHVHAAGVFTHLFNEKKAKSGIEQPSIIDNWLVLDGEASPQWVDALSSMMDSNNKLTLANGATVRNTSFTSMIFETGSLQSASPSSVARCSVIHCNQKLTSWKYLVSSWMLQARHKWIFNTQSLKMLNTMISETFESTLQFMSAELATALDANLTQGHSSYMDSVTGIHEVQTFLKIMTALLDRYMLRESSPSEAGLTGASGVEGRNTTSMASTSLGGMRSQSAQDEDYASHENMFKCIFVYSYIWGFGGHLCDSSRFKFDQYAKEVLYRGSNSVTLPRTGSVYDLFVDAKEGKLNKWQDKPAERLRSIPANYAITSDIERIYHVTDLLLSSNNHVLITGQSGIGKTALVTNMMMTRQHFTKISMCPSLSSAMFQKQIIVRLQDLKQKTLFSLGPQGGGIKPPQRHMFFIDDLSTAKPISEDNHTQPCLEALREMMSHNITYDRQRHVFQDAKPATFLSACSTPGFSGTGYGVNGFSLSDRLVRQMTVINFFSLTDDGMHSLYGKTLQTWLEEFPSYAIEHHHEFAKAMMQGILDMYKVMRDKFKATPAHGHYVFTLHDISHIVEGMLLLSPRKTKSKPRRARARRDNPVTASNVASLFGGMLPGGKVSKDKFRALSVKDSKDTKNQSIDSALPMMPVLARLWCHEVSRTFADRLLTDDDDIWFKKTLRDLVEKHFCTASPDWLDSHAASKQMRAIFEENTRYDYEQKVGEKGAMKGTPLPFGHALGGDLDSDESDLSDGSMTEVTADVITPFSEHDMDPDSFDSTHGGSQQKVDNVVTGRRDSDSDEDDNGAITPFTETTVNLPDMPMSPETDEEKPTFDHFQQQQAQMSVQFNDMHEKRITHSDSSSEASEGSDTENDASTVQENTDVDSPNATSQVAESSIEQAVSTSDSSRTGHRAARITAADLTAATAIQNVAAQQPAVAGGVIKKQRRTGANRRADSKRGVTFKMGLIADKEIQEEYKGALMNYDEIRGVTEDLSEIVFSKYYINAYADYVGMNSERGYAQYTESQIGEALEACLHIYNQQTHADLRLVFFKEAARHATRISRLLSFSGAHALLLGLPHSAGRTTLIRLASHISHCKAFEVKSLETEEQTLKDFKAKVIQASHAAGVIGRSSILYIHSGLPESVLADVCCLMTEGRYPGLYSDIDMQNMATAMTPGQVQTKKLDKIELSFERYLKKVRQNMHIFVCLDISATRSIDTFHLLRKYPQLITKATHVDCYKPWSFHTYQYVAKKWLMSPQTADKVKWDRELYMNQLTCISKAMAYVHKTSQKAVQQLYCHSSDIQAHKIYNPLTFQEFYHLFLYVANTINKRAQSKVEVLRQVHEKVDEAFTSIRNLEAQSFMLEPKLAGASRTVTDLRSKVEQWREKYIEALNISKECEEKLAELKKPLIILRGQADAEFDKVNQTYYAAMAAINSLSQKDLEELRGYRCPPEVIKPVWHALCLMFNTDAVDWSTAQQLMSRKNFFQDMEFYDKTHMPPKLYDTLRQYCKTSNFHPDVVKKGSAAAGAICMWIHSVYKYAEIYNQVAPKLAKLMGAEEQVNKIQAELGQKRIYATKTKKELEGLIAEHKEASQRAKILEKQYQALKKRITDAKEIMSNMDMQIKIWRAQLMEAEIKIDCAPGDAMLVAAMCCYHGPLDAHTREDLINDWRERTYFNEFDTNKALETRMERVNTTGHINDIPSINDRMREQLSSAGSSQVTQLKKPQKIARRPIFVRSDFSLESILSDFDEVSGWVRSGLGHDIHRLHNILIMRMCAQNQQNYWPLLIDPDNQAPNLIKITHNTFSSNTSVSDMLSELEPMRPLSGMAERFGGNTPVLPPVTASTGTRATSPGTANQTTTSDGDSQSVMTTSGVSQSTRRASLSARKSPGSELGALYLSRQVSLNKLAEMEALFKPDPQIERPDDNLWVVPATDPDINKYIINALVHGVVVLVTHTERKLAPLELLNILYKKYHKDSETGKPTVQIKDFVYHIHPRFRLYLSVNTTMHTKGDDTRRVPLGHANLIDLSHSQQSHVDLLLSDIMRIEQPDFEAQARSLEGGILHHKHELNTEQESIQSKVVNGVEHVLDDVTMLSTLHQSQQHISRNAQILEETLYLNNQLLQKRESYMPVALHAAMMYEVIGHLSLLSPYYSLNFDLYQKLCSDTVRSRFRGKGVTGAPKARCQELINAITEQVFKLMSTMLFEADWKLFALLVTIQRMSSAQAFSQDELHVFVNDVKHLQLTSNRRPKEKPQWMAHESWLSCHKLEDCMPCFHGLTDIITSRTKEWREYFTSNMSVVSRLPGESFSLSLMQKFILWRIVRPDRFSEICENLMLTELGPNVVHIKPPGHEVILKSGAQNMPVVLIEPAVPPTNRQDCENSNNSTHSGYLSHDPVELIRSMLPAQTADHIPRVSVLSFGRGVFMADVQQMITQSMQNGAWLILHNCHLAPQWSAEVLQQIRNVLGIQTVDYDNHEQRNKKKPAEIYEETNPGVNPNFRLWFVTQHTKVGRILPGAVIRNSTKYVLEQQQPYQDLLKTVYTHSLSKTSNLHPDTNITVQMLISALVLPLSILHSQLTQRRRYVSAAYKSPPQWTIDDLNTILSNMRYILSSCDGADKLTDYVISVYAPYCTEEDDISIVEATVKSLLKTRAELTDKEVELNSRGSQALLATLVPEVGLPCDSQDILDRLSSLSFNDASVLGLTESADTHLKQINSRNMSELLSHISGHPDLINSTSAHANMFERVDVLLSGWESVLHSLPELSYTPEDHLHPLQNFLHKQVMEYKSLIQTLINDCELFHGITRSEYSCTKQSLLTIQELYMGKVPTQWRSYLRSSADTLMQWKSDLETSCTLLLRYVDGASQTRPVLYNLSVFTNPRLFLDTLLVHHSRQNYQDIGDLELHAQFLPMGFTPTTPPEIGCYITGLSVHNALWDTTNCTIKAFDVHDEALSNQLPLLHIKPRLQNPVKQEQETPEFNCTVSCGAGGNLCRETGSQIITVRLPASSEQDIRDLVERRVIICSMLSSIDNSMTR